MPQIERHVIPVTRAESATYALPYWVVDSGRPGPALLVTAALHGNEIQACEALRRVLPELEARLTSGRCCLVPFANPCAVRRRQPSIDFDPLRRYTGSERRINVNCAWPGDPHGSDAERLAAALKEAVVDHATHALDLHAWHGTMAPTALCRHKHAESIRLAQAAGMPFARSGEWLPEIRERPVLPCTLASLFNDTGRAALTIEFSGQYGFAERQIQWAERSVRNVLRALEMFPGDLERPCKTCWLDANPGQPLTAPGAGLFVPVDGLQPGDDIEAQAPLGSIVDLQTLSGTVLTAPVSGRLFSYGAHHKDRGGSDTMSRHHPYVDSGEEIARLVAV